MNIRTRGVQAALKLREMLVNASEIKSMKSAQPHPAIRPKQFRGPAGWPIPGGDRLAWSFMDLRIHAGF
jgi:hypothetical protein